MLSTEEKKNIISHVIGMGENELNNFKDCLDHYTDEKNAEAYEYLHSIEKYILAIIDETGDGNK